MVVNLIRSEFRELNDRIWMTTDWSAAFARMFFEVDDITSVQLRMARNRLNGESTFSFFKFFFFTYTRLIDLNDLYMIFSYFLSFFLLFRAADENASKRVRLCVCESSEDASRFSLCICKPLE